MALDAALKKELLDAREKIIAQLNETQFPTTPGVFSRRGGGPTYDYAYLELQQELREIDELLGSDENDQDRAIPTAVPLPTSFTRGRQPEWNLTLVAPALVVVLGAMFAVLFVLLRMLMTS